MPLRLISRKPSVCVTRSAGPAGTLTPTLDIPLTNNSFFSTFPAYGGYVPGTGLTLGLAMATKGSVFSLAAPVAAAAAIDAHRRATASGDGLDIIRQGRIAQFANRLR